MSPLSLLPSEPCPCGSTTSYAACCGPFLQGGSAPTAESLMRSRFTANVVGNADYLMSTWHSTTRPAQLDLQHRPDWVSLEVRAVEAGGPADLTGTVEFVARYRDGNRMGILHEKSHFTREEGRWYYVDGDLRESEPGEKIGRNDPCPCGSGRKLKKCCGA